MERPDRPGGVGEACRPRKAVETAIVGATERESARAEPSPLVEALCWTMSSRVPDSGRSATEGVLHGDAQCEACIEGCESAVRRCVVGGPSLDSSLT